MQNASRYEAETYLGWKIKEVSYELLTAIHIRSLKLLKSKLSSLNIYLLLNSRFKITTLKYNIKREL